MGIQARLNANPHFAHVMTLPEHVVNRSFGSQPNLIDMAIICALGTEEAIYHSEDRDRQVIEDLLEDRADGWTPAQSAAHATRFDGAARLYNYLFLEQLFSQEAP